MEMLKQLVHELTKGRVNNQFNFTCLSSQAMLWVPGQPDVPARYANPSPDYARSISSRSSSELDRNDFGLVKLFHHKRINTT